MAAMNPPTAAMRTSLDAEVAEIQLRVDTGWLSKEEAHKLKTLLKMGQSIVRTSDKDRNWTHNTDALLKEYLLVREENTPLKKVLNAIGYSWLQRQLRAADAKKEAVNTSLFVHIVESDYFESAMGLVMFANAIMIGFQVSSTDDDENSAHIYEILDFVFTTIFVVELVLRYCCEGWRWWFRGSNIFDVVVVLATNLGGGGLGLGVSYTGILKSGFGSLKGRGRNIVLPIIEVL